MIQFKIALCESRIKAGLKRDWWEPLLQVCQTLPNERFRDEILNEFLSLSDESSSPPILIDHLDACGNWDPSHHGMSMADLCLRYQNYDGAIRWIVRVFIPGRHENSR